MGEIVLKANYFETFRQWLKEASTMELMHILQAITNKNLFPDVFATVIPDDGGQRSADDEDQLPVPSRSQVLWIAMLEYLFYLL